jgi:putative toxin-antitoxin system antitoxin component (TIGR02293 family)
MQAQTVTAASFLELVSTIPSLRYRGLLRQIIGISERTLKIQVAKDPSATLTLAQRKYAEQVSAILSHATEVMGSVALANCWLTRRAIGLGSRAPLKLLMTQAGCLALREHLVRLEYGVYC